MTKREKEQEFAEHFAMAVAVGFALFLIALAVWA
jgi:hypothetical protein